MKVENRDSLYKYSIFAVISFTIRIYQYWQLKYFDFRSLLPTQFEGTAPKRKYSWEAIQAYKEYFMKDKQPLPQIDESDGAIELIDLEGVIPKDESESASDSNPKKKDEQPPKKWRRKCLGLPRLEPFSALFYSISVCFLLLPISL